MDAELLPFMMTVKREPEAADQDTPYAHQAQTPTIVAANVPCAIQEKTSRTPRDGHAVPVTTSRIFSNYEEELLTDDLLEVATPLRTRNFKVDAAHPVYDEEVGVLDHWELLVIEVKAT